MSIEKLAQGIVSWIKKSVLAARGSGVVFGMSGGVDSSVVAVLCQKAFPNTSLGIIMPCHSNILDKKHAELVANEFHISNKVIVLDKVFNKLVKAFSENDYNTATQMLAEANIKPRLRMLTLYYFNRLR
jgi:NAD+ synthase